MTESAILALINVLKLQKASLRSCQDLRPRVTSANKEEEEQEEAKADTEQMLSVLFGTSCSGLGRSSCLLARLSHAAEWSRQSYQGRSHFSDLGVKLPRAELGGCEMSLGTEPCLPATLGAAALAADTCGRVGDTAPTFCSG